jgi:hypothetical protein
VYHVPHTIPCSPHPPLLHPFLAPPFPQVLH